MSKGRAVVKSVPSLKGLAAAQLLRRCWPMEIQSQCDPSVLFFFFFFSKKTEIPLLPFLIYEE